MDHFTLWAAPLSLQKFYTAALLCTHDFVFVFKKIFIYSDIIFIWLCSSLFIWYLGLHWSAWLDVILISNNCKFVTFSFSCCEKVENLWHRIQQSVEIVVKVMTKEKDRADALLALGKFDCTFYKTHCVLIINYILP